MSAAAFCLLYTQCSVCRHIKKRFFHGRLSQALKTDTLPPSYVLTLTIYVHMKVQ